MTMRFGFVSVLGLLMLGGLGCGAGGIASEAEAATDDSSDGSGDGDDDPGDGEGDGDGEPGDGDGDPSAASCIEDGELTRALAIVDNETMRVHVLELGGVERVLDAPLPPGSNAEGRMTVDANQDYVAVASNVVGIEGGAMLRLFDRDDGELVWAIEFEDRRLGQFHLDAQGRIVAAYAWSAAPAPTGVLIIDGEASDMPSLYPVGPIGAEGWVPVWINNDLGEQVGTGFYRPLSDELISISEGSTPPGWHADGETIEYIDNAPAIPELVIAGPESSHRIALTAFADVDADVHLEGFAGDYRLLAANLDQDQPPMLVRLHVPSETLLDIEIAAPEGLEAFDCYFQRTAIDVEGRILVELRDPGAAQIHAWDPDDDQWTPLGAAMTGVDDIASGGRFGRVEVIWGYGAGMTYCPYAEWSEPPAEAIVGDTLQLARVDPPLELVIPAPSHTGVVVDATEACASWLGDGERVVHDLVDGDTLGLAHSGWAIWLK